MKLHDGDDVWIRFRVTAHNDAVKRYILSSKFHPYLNILYADVPHKDIRVEPWGENAKRQPVDK